MVTVRFSALKNTKLSEWLARFAFGGAATVLAGVIAKEFGARVGGLFLAFPAICPATLTLIESHEKPQLHKEGHHGTKRGRMAAALDARGAVLGCMGLMGFAGVLWKLLPQHNAALVLLAGLAAWTVISWRLWWASRKRIFHRPAKRPA